MESPQKVDIDKGLQYERGDPFILELAKAWWWRRRYGGKASQVLRVIICSHLPDRLEGYISFYELKILIADRTTKPVLTLFHELNHWWVYATLGCDREMSDDEVERLARRDRRNFWQYMTRLGHEDMQMT